MNETNNIMFWINILITVEQPLQYPHIDHSHGMLTMNKFCDGKKQKFTKNYCWCFINSQRVVYRWRYGENTKDIKSLGVNQSTGCFCAMWNPPRCAGRCYSCGGYYDK